ncbi:hypothetical protein L6164_029341 [Bauhinia variegata]|uniref:Uncharacterized protein n=1 Tax=Bauhinia variegata TaxID=167791 RepID=A0ACB9L8C8_BAUVA|nr:hypothetical protein L6164_029341 [Bauhinia variegata]
MCRNSYFLLVCLLLGTTTTTTIVLGGNFTKDFDVLFGGQNINIEDGGNSISLQLDQVTGSGIKSKYEYLFGRFDMQIKLVPGNSAGTVTAYYLSSAGPQHDEIDLEFLGNLSGDPYLLSTNIFANGHGGREVQFYLWFDPTTDFHTYSVDWNPQRIIILVDNIPLRVMHNRKSIGVSFPTKQPMKLYVTLWNGDSWATRWGQVKIDWKKAPFVASFRNFKANARVADCRDQFDEGSIKKMKEIQSKWTVYDYCLDFRRYSHGLPYECRKQNKLASS